MCEYQIELRRIRRELEKMLKQAETTRHIAKKNSRTKAYQRGRIDALQSALQIINEPGELLA